MNENIQKLADKIEEDIWKGLSTIYVNIDNPEGAYNFVTVDKQKIIDFITDKCNKNRQAIKTSQDIKKSLEQRIIQEDFESFCRESV